MARRREEAEQTKRLITDKAMELFAQKGYAATSMEEIRTSTGMSKGSIYYHFKSKEVLFLHLLHVNMQNWIDKWELLSRDAPTATEKLYALADHFASDFQNPLIKAAEEFIGSRAANPEVMEELMKLTLTPLPVVKSIIDEGLEKGDLLVDNADDLTLIFYALMGGLGITQDTMDFESIRALYRKAIHIFLRGAAVKL